MLLQIILFFTLVPFLELYLLLAAASTLGVPETLGICLLTGVAGGYLARREGVAVWTQLREQLGQGQAPGVALLEAFLVFAGGLLLLTPGIATDVLGFSMVLPFTRRPFAREVARRVQESLQQGIQSGAVQFHMVGGGMPGGPREADSAGPRAEDPYRDHPDLRRLP